MEIGKIQASAKLGVMGHKAMDKKMKKNKKKRNAIKIIADESVVQDKLVEWMRRSHPFTSVDIANEIKSEGTFIRNRMVAEILRSTVLAISNQLGMMYECSLVRVHSKRDGDTFTYLYHPMGFDIENYMDRDQVARGKS